ncbi:hypothetical protein DPX39_090061000 [Trypanosoma brucei equiperdum]|uniref:Uncharacterized protein n=1 Tax=Trypanosoma brucei equiperdum TaxID=630700 RepID=A0A3L6L141_9TRYP|nr:hypothetical protein DPX39_090061000 [Trypanosoma brucei equiperdum]
MSWRTRVVRCPLQEPHNPFDMGRVMQRFWSPFCKGVKGPDLHTYGFGETFSGMRTHDSDFTCQVNGQVGGAKLVEDFFITLLCGFDFEHVKVERHLTTSGAADPCQFQGTIVLAHTRSFLGWCPQPVTHSLEKCPSPSECDATKVSTNNINELGNTTATASRCLVQTGGNTEAPVPSLILNVPFTARLEGNVGRISHMILRSPAIGVIAAHQCCPAEVGSCLQNPEALQALVTLRRANVRPEMITDRTLVGITAKKAAWCSALGIL